MTDIHSYTVSPGWRVVLADAGIDPVSVLKRAGLPTDLLNRDRVSLPTDRFFSLWRGLEEESGDPLFPLHVGSMVTVEAFDPPLFAAMCSPDLNTALRRISHYKRLIGPMTLHVDVRDDFTQIELEWLDKTQPPPVGLVLAELVFFVQLSRIGTRAQVMPLQVATPELPATADGYAEYFGVNIDRAPRPTVRFSAADATRPFLTENEAMWRFFEPELRKRLSEMEESATTTQRVRAALLELLPVGSSTVESVSDRLGTTPRTLQRRLRAEGRSFQSILNETRESLAKHYLGRSEISSTEISFLLGFENPNSFFRAFHSWTGVTPERARRELVTSA